jgi:predicted DNA-binding transcriptional regulator AlpA
MKTRKKELKFSEELESNLYLLLERYEFLSRYVEQTLINSELISTAQIVEKYYVSRHTIYRMQKAGLLLPKVKTRSLYFDANETNIFFNHYWRRN